MVLQSVSLLERKRLCLQVGRVGVATGCKALQRAKGRKSTEKPTGVCLDLQLHPLQEWMQKAIGGRVKDLWWWFMARWCGWKKAARSTAGKLRSHPAVQSCCFLIPKCVCASVSMSTADENPKSQSTSSSQKRDNFLSQHEASLCRPQTSPVPPAVEYLPSSQPLAASSDLSFLEKGLCCWPHILRLSLHRSISVTWRVVQHFMPPSGRWSPETASQGHRVWR